MTHLNIDVIFQFVITRTKTTERTGENIPKSAATVPKLNRSKKIE
jgi:hypothetical protein